MVSARQSTNHELMANGHLRQVLDDRFLAEKLCVAGSTLLFIAPIVGNFIYRLKRTNCRFFLRIGGVSLPGVSSTADVKIPLEGSHLLVQLFLALSFENALECLRCDKANQHQNYRQQQQECAGNAKAQGAKEPAPTHQFLFPTHDETRVAAPGSGDYVFS